MKRIAILTGLIFIICDIFAQGELLEEDNIFYKNERTFAVVLGSNGLGLNYRYGKRLTALRKVIYEIDFASIRHPKEIQLSSSVYLLSSRSFVFGKLNQFYSLRAGIGLHDELFPKIDKGGISIRRYYAFGPSIGIAKPIYYNFEIIGYDINGEPYIESTVVDKFQNSQHIQSSIISGKASFFKGFDETSLIPGLYTKLGVMFEFGKYNQTIHAIDAGILLDGFIKKIEIMDDGKDQYFFLTLFASYRFGRVIDAKYKMKRSKIDEIVTD
ncbi:MAG: hypothetical protein JXB00_09060 [Bacteroidales bacterium]|nr:hypothetical protein [Bacteroidales bacterium]